MEPIFRFPRSALALGSSGVSSRDKSKSERGSDNNVMWRQDATNKSPTRPWACMWIVLHYRTCVCHGGCTDTFRLSGFPSSNKAPGSCRGVRVGNSSTSAWWRRRRCRVLATGRTGARATQSMWVGRHFLTMAIISMSHASERFLVSSRVKWRATLKVSARLVTGRVYSTLRCTGT